MDDWFQAGIQLGVKEYELKTIEQNYPKDSKRCKDEMFIAWLNSDPSASYEKLAKALFAIGKKSIAESICSAHGECVLIEAKVLSVNQMLKCGKMVLEHIHGDFG